MQDLIVEEKYLKQALEFWRNPGYIRRLPPSHYRHILSMQKFQEVWDCIYNGLYYVLDHDTELDNWDKFMNATLEAGQGAGPRTHRDLEDFVRQGDNTVIVWLTLALQSDREFHSYYDLVHTAANNAYYHMAMKLARAIWYVAKLYAKGEDEKVAVHVRDYDNRDASRGTSFCGTKLAFLPYVASTKNATCPECLLHCYWIEIGKMIQNAENYAETHNIDLDEQKGEIS